MAAFRLQRALLMPKSQLVCPHLSDAERKKLDKFTALKVFLTNFSKQRASHTVSLPGEFEIFYTAAVATDANKLLKTGLPWSFMYL